MKSNKECIGIVTCFLDNCGACLQAYALQQVITSIGYSSEIIKFMEPWGYYDTTIKNNNSIAIFLKRILRKNFKKKYDTGLYKELSFIKFRRKYLHFSNKTYSHSSDLEPQPVQYDTYVCGSDQIWNPTFYDKCNPIYYLAFVNDTTPKIAYAPSIGLGDIPEIYRGDFIRYVNRLNYVSVREEQGVNIVNKYTEKKAKLVLDPTLLLYPIQWEKLALKRKTHKPYVFCYLFGNHAYYTDVINRIAKINGYQIRIIPFFENELQPDFIIEKNAGPREFLSLIKDADLVLTDSFHASVFSILFKKSFYVLRRDSDNDVNSMNSRIYNLLSIVGLNDRLLSKDEACSIQIKPIDRYEEVHKLIDMLRTDSLNYLRNALEGR